MAPTGQGAHGACRTVRSARRRARSCALAGVEHAAEPAHNAQRAVRCVAHPTADVVRLVWQEPQCGVILREDRLCGTEGDAEGAEEGAEEGVYATVSYTHLTLPTKA